MLTYLARDGRGAAEPTGLPTGCGPARRAAVATPASVRRGG